MTQGKYSGRLTNINQLVIEELGSSRLLVEHAFILDCLFHKDYDTLDKYDKNFTEERALNNYQTLERKQLIVPDPNNNTYYIISVEGTELYNKLINLSQNILSTTQTTSIGVMRRRNDKLFEEWWTTYPSNASWISEDGRKFISGRSLRSGKKEDNKKEYLKILNEGIYTHTQMMNALKYEIDAKKKQSLLTNNNALQYMQGSLTYLRNRNFENFMNLTIEEGGSNYEVGN